MGVYSRMEELGITIQIKSTQNINVWRPVVLLDGRKEREQSMMISSGTAWTAADFGGAIIKLGKEARADFENVRR